MDILKSGYNTLKNVNTKLKDTKIISRAGDFLTSNPITSTILKNNPYISYDTVKSATNIAKSHGYGKKKK